ncbi:SDR family oxidoreductase [Pelomonas cellulosilytica]|uniref:SDR family oxidoreductase n=1 Tax=Pelomonas cellulosilytica TaxID=2906762 RepID=A0ABS8XY85_9BURK|nr:SDR family oxidoreductase [Pelomonas sp. P8]MCE4556640.1 SDR family oxidoreductase [Pelomonas sp. P8]
MHVFVTGATGFIGSAIVQELLSHGHRVTGLARSDAAVEALAAAGAAAYRGSIEDLDSLRRGAAAADAVIHTAFNHDFSRFAASCEEDRHVITALGDALASSGRRLVVTSGTALVAGKALAIETDAPSTRHPRAASEQAVAALVERGVNASVVRLPPSVHGDGDHGFVPLLIDLASQKGLAAYVGDGHNRWPAVHRLDAAELFRRVAEAGRAGVSYHGAAETGVRFCDLTAVIGRRLGLPVRGLEVDAAAAHFGWLHHFAGMDNPTSSDWTQRELGWRPRRIGLLADVDQPGYFSN